jgi:protein-S-isoprenylcysteine O-methyltransferase Ste14
LNFKKKLKENYQLVVVLLAISVVFIGAVLLKDITVNSIVVLQSMIQAEATVLGFFGIVISYMLASYDSRLDRLEQQRFDSEIENNSLKLTMIDSKISGLKALKKSSTNGLGIYSLILILALLFSIVTLGVRDFNLSIANILGVFGLGFFFMGILGIVFSFLQMSAET